jgi:hypothetical protein
MRKIQFQGLRNIFLSASTCRLRGCPAINWFLPLTLSLSGSLVRLFFVLIEAISNTAIKTAMLHPQSYASDWCVFADGPGRPAFFRDLLSHHDIRYLVSEKEAKDKIFMSSLQETEKLISSATATNLRINFKLKAEEIHQTIDWIRGFDYWMRKYRTTKREAKYYETAHVPVDSESNPIKPVIYRPPKQRSRGDPRHQVLDSELLRVAFKEYELFLFNATERVREVAAATRVGWVGNSKGAPSFTKDLSLDEPSGFTPSIRTSPERIRFKPQVEYVNNIAWLRKRESKERERNSDLTYRAVPYRSAPISPKVPKSPPESPPSWSWSSPPESDTPCYLADLMWHCAFVLILCSVTTLIGIFVQRTCCIRSSMSTPAAAMWAASWITKSTNLWSSFAGI